MGVSYNTTIEMSRLLVQKLKLQFVYSTCASYLIRQVNVREDPTYGKVVVEIPSKLYSREYFSDHGEKLVISKKQSVVQRIQDFTSKIPMQSNGVRIKRKELPKPKMVQQKRYINVMDINELIANVVNECMSIREQELNVIGTEISTVEVAE